MTESTLISACVSACLTAAMVNLCKDNSDSGKNVHEVIANIRYKPYEIMALFDADGHKICERTDHSQEFVVTIVPQELRTQIHMMIHNHVDDRTFSTYDLTAGRECDLDTSILVTPNCNFYLSRPKAGWPEGNEWLEEYELMVNKFRQYSHYANDLNTAYHLAMTELAKRYGMRYYVSNLEDNRKIS